MIEWGGFALLRPWWLLALPAIAAPLWRARRAGRLGGWTTAMDPNLLRAMQRFGRVLPGRAPGRWLPAVLAALLVIALAGPALRKAGAPTFRNLDGVVVVMDLSRSVALAGALPTALAAGRLVAGAADGRSVALIVYAGDAYLVSPFTTDAEAVETTIGALDAETVPDAGSCLRCALLLARVVLAESGTLASDVVLVSDGAGTADARGERDALLAEGARISTLYVAPREQLSDMPAPSPSALADLAAGTGWTAEAARPAAVLAALTAGRGPAGATGDIALLTWRDLGRYLAILPALLALGLFRRSA